MCLEACPTHERAAPVTVKISPTTSQPSILKSDISGTMIIGPTAAAMPIVIE